MNFKEQIQEGIPTKLPAARKFFEDIQKLPFFYENTHECPRTVKNVPEH